MKLFSIQPIDVWEKLQKEEVLLADPLLGGHINLNWPQENNHALEEDSFYQAYDWMRQQMAERLPDYQGNWPWWAWHTWTTVEDKPIHSPDLRKERYNYRLDEGWVRLQLEIPDENVLLSCFDGWHCVLNHWFICHNEEEDEKLDQEWRMIRYGDPKIGMAELRTMIKEGVPPPPISPEQQAKMDDFNRRRKESWEKVFDLDWMRSSPLWQGGMAIQACFEELRLDQVQKVAYFKGARKPRS